MKYNFKLKTIVKSILLLITTYTIAIPNLSSQVINDNSYNATANIVEFVYSDLSCNATGILSGTSASLKTGDICISSLTGALPLVKSTNEKLYDVVGIQAEEEDFLFEAWTNVLPGSVCNFDVQSVTLPFLGEVISPSSDVCHRIITKPLQFSFDSPSQLNTQTLQLGPNTITLESAWRYSNGDDELSPLDFGELANNTMLNHQNSTRPLTLNGRTDLAYSNQASAVDFLNNTVDVIYTFSIPSGLHNVEISTDHNFTNFDTEIHLYTFYGTDYIESNDDNGSPLNFGLNSKLVQNLNGGKYFVIVEGALNSTSGGEFELSIISKSISLNEGSITQATPSDLCSGALLPAIMSNTDGSTTPATTGALSYQWFKKIGSGDYTAISGAIDKDLTSMQAGEIMGNEILQYKRATYSNGITSGFTNEVTFNPIPQTSDLGLGFNSPICGGNNTTLSIFSNGTGNGGAIVHYNIDGAASQTITLDTNGEASIPLNNITATTNTTIEKITQEGCETVIDLLVQTDIFPTITPIDCASAIVADNTNGSEVFQFEDQNGKADVYSFTATGGTDEVVIELTGSTSSVDFDLLLIDECDPYNIIASSVNYEDSNEEIRMTLAAGNYQIIVIGLELTDVGLYTLSLESCGTQNVCEVLEDVACDEELIGENPSLVYYPCALSTIYAKIYQITPEFGGSMTINLTNLSTNFDLAFHDATTLESLCSTVISCNQLAFSNNGGTNDEQIVYTINAGETYYVEVFGFNSGTYDIEFVCPTGNPCTNAIDYVVAEPPLNDVCIGSMGTYHIVPALNAVASPGATLTYSINAGADQTVVLDGAGEAMIDHTPTVEGNPGSVIDLKEISLGACSIQLNHQAQFNVNGFPTSFSVSSNSGLVCVGGPAEFYITGSPGVNDPTPYANITYQFTGPDFPVGGEIRTQKVDETGFLTVILDEISAGNTTLSMISGEVNGCVVSYGNQVTTVPWEFAHDVTVTAQNTSICPGDDAVFLLNGFADEHVELDLTGSGAPTQTVILDSNGEGSITVSTPSSDARVDIYKVKYSPFNNSFFTPCTVEYELDENFAEVKLTEIGELSVGYNNTACLGSTMTFYFSKSSTTSASPNGILDFTVNGVNNSINLDASGEAIFTTTAAVVGNFNLTATSITSGSCVNNFNLSINVTVHDVPEPVAVEAMDETICAGEDAVFLISPAPGAAANNAGDEISYSISGGAVQTIALNASGEATITVTNPTSSVSIEIIEVSTPNSCSTPVGSAAVVTLADFPNPVEVLVNSDICSDGLASFVIQAPSGGTPTINGVVNYTLDGVSNTATLDELGTALITVADETGLANDHTIVLISIVSFENEDCAITLSGAGTMATLTCDIPCYDHSILNAYDEGLHSYYNSDYLETTSIVSSENTITEIEYLAGESITLGIGFESDPGSEILADIQSCISNCPCGNFDSQASPTGSAEVPFDFLRWTASNDASCITDMVFDNGNVNAHIEVNVKSYVSGNSGPFYADVSMKHPNSNDRTTITDIVVPVGMSTIPVGLFTASNGAAYLTEVQFDFTNAPVVDATVQLTPWCITPEPPACNVLGATGQAEAPADVLRYNLVEGAYCLEGIQSAQSDPSPHVEVNVGSFVGSGTSVVNVDLNFTPPGSSGATSQSIQLTDGAAAQTFNMGVYSAANGKDYNVDVTVSYLYIPSASIADLVTAVILVTPN